MTQERFWPQVGARLRELLGWEAARADSDDEFDRLFGDLRQATAVLAQARNQIQALRRQFAELEQDADLLAERVRVSCRLGDAGNAWQLALHLDSHRQAVEKARSQLHAQQQTCSLYQRRVDQIKQGLADLQASHSVSNHGKPCRPRERRDEIP